MKKFIFSKFAGLQAYSQQLYYQMNSFTGIFRQHFKPPMLPPSIDFSPSSNFEAPHVLNTCGNPHNKHEMKISLFHSRVTVS